MDRREVAANGARTFDPRDSDSLASRLSQKKIGGVDVSTRRWQSGEELEWQTQLPRLGLELIPIGAIPRHNGIEGTQLLDKRAWRIDARQPHQVEPRGSNRPRRIGKA